MQSQYRACTIVHRAVKAGLTQLQRQNYTPKFLVITIDNIRRARPVAQPTWASVMRC